MMNNTRTSNTQTNDTQIRRLARQAGILSAALFLIACSAGLGYAAHLTREVTRRADFAPQSSVLPLVVLAIGAAVAGIAVARLAVHSPDREQV
jgi:hypothetical protein